MDLKNFLESKKQTLLNEEGQPLIIFHGTNRSFDSHDTNKHRTILNSKFQGDWICYTDNYQTAMKYMEAARNQCFDKDFFFEDLDSFFNKRPLDGIEKYLSFLAKELVEKGFQHDVNPDTYESVACKYIQENNIETNDPLFYFFRKLDVYSELYNFDINELSDILEFVECSKMNNNPTLNLNFFHQTIVDIPSFAIDYLVENDFLNSIPKPRVISSHIKFSKCLKTNDREEAKNAKNLGYDLVIYNGEGCVDNSPEYLILNPEQIEIIKIDKYKKIIEYLDESKSSWNEHIELLESEDKNNKNKKLKI